MMQRSPAPLKSNCTRLQTKEKNLSMAWIDYQKAFDKVPHSWENYLGLMIKLQHLQKGYDKLENTHAPTNRK